MDDNSCDSLYLYKEYSYTKNYMFKRVELNEYRKKTVIITDTSVLIIPFESIKDEKELNKSICRVASRISTNKLASVLEMSLIQMTLEPQL